LLRRRLRFAIAATLILLFDAADLFIILITPLFVTPLRQMYLRHDIIAIIISPLPLRLSPHIDADD